MPVDISAADLVRQLRRVGLRPSERLAQNILEHGEEVVAPLIELAGATELLNEDEPTCYGPVHALRLLGELRPPSMIEPLLAKLPVTQLREQDRAPQIWANELPQIIARLGGDAIAPLTAYADDEQRPEAQRAASINALAYIATYEPETRQQIVEWLRARLAAASDPMIAGYVVAGLSQLGVKETYAEVMAAFREGRASKDVISPGEARQWLLSKIEKRLSCVSHPLWERYDEHGPFSKEEYELADEYADEYDDD